MNCYSEFKLRYLKNLKLCSTRVKVLFEPIALRLKKKIKSLWSFHLFKSIFLRNRSLSNAMWFYGKKRKIGKGNLYLTENRLGRNEIWHTEDNRSCMGHICAQGFSESNFNWAVIDQISIFSRNCPKFHIFIKIIIFKVQFDFFRPTAKEYTFLFLQVVSR